LEKFEFIGYGNGDTGELYNRHFKTAFDEWRDVSHSDPITLFNMIAADGIDILINMVGYSSLNSLRCMNSRMAPIQVLWAKEPYAGALPGVDYIVSDWLPSDLMEKKIEIEAGSVFCARHQGVEKKTVDRDDRLTFVADAAFVDLDPVTIALWAKVLLKIPESMLLLRSHDFFAEENSKTLIDRFSMMGIAHRVDILQEPSRLNFFQNGDLALLPSQGADAEVVYDAFDAGVPVFWAFEDAKKTSEAYTILNAFDATHQFVFETSEEMLSGIKAWLENEKAKTFHEDIQQQMKESLLMDPEGRMRKIENLLWNLWDKKCSD
jgi:predicted O-linked N-acetylglucosamine transferase (SPINDLY family)